MNIIIMIAVSDLNHFTDIRAQGGKAICRHHGYSYCKEWPEKVGGHVRGRENNIVKD